MIGVVRMWKRPKQFPQVPPNLESSSMSLTDVSWSSLSPIRVPEASVVSATNVAIAQNTWRRNRSRMRAITTASRYVVRSDSKSRSPISSYDETKHDDKENIPPVQSRRSPRSSNRSSPALVLVPSPVSVDWNKRRTSAIRRNRRRLGGHYKLPH